MSRRKVATGLQEVCEFETKPQLLLRIRFELRLAAERTFLNRTQVGLVCHAADVGKNLAGGCAIDRLPEQWFQIGITLLCPEHVHTELKNIRIGGRRVHAPFRLIVNQRLVVLTRRKSKQARLGSVALSAERA